MDSDSSESCDEEELMEHEEHLWEDLWDDGLGDISIDKPETDDKNEKLVISKKSMIPFSGPRHEDDYPQFDAVLSLEEFDEYDSVDVSAWDKLPMADQFTMDGNCFDCSTLVEHWSPKPSSSTITFVCSDGNVVVDEDFVCKMSEKLMVYLKLDPHQAQIRFIYAYDADSASLQMLLNIAHYTARPESKEVGRSVGVHRITRGAPDRFSTMLETYRLAERWEMQDVCVALGLVVDHAYDWVLYRNLWRIAEMTEEEYLKRQRILEDAQAALQKCRKDEKEGKEIPISDYGTVDLKQVLESVLEWSVWR